MRIYKYPLRIQDRQTVQLPRGARPLSIGYQSGDIMLWCLVDPEAPKRQVKVAIVGTGHHFEPDGWAYVGTAWWTPPFVWHVFVDAGLLEAGQ